MNHKITKELLSLYLDRKLDAPQRAELDVHLASCPECAQELNTLTALRAWMKETPATEPPPAFYDRVLREIDARAQAKRSRPFWSGRTFGWAATALTAGLVIYVVTDVRFRDRAPQYQYKKLDDRASSWVASQKAAPAPAAAPAPKSFIAGAEGSSSLADSRLMKESEFAQEFDAPKDGELPMSAPRNEALQDASTLERKRRAGAAGDSFSDDKSLPAPALGASISSARPAPLKLRGKLSEPAETAIDASTPAPSIKEKNAAPWGADDEWRGISCGIEEPLTLVVRDSKTWSALWKRFSSNHVPPPPVPRVDFSREMVVAVFLGQKSSGGYDVALQDAVISRDKWVIPYVERSPQPGAFLPAALTEPYHMRVLPRTSLPVEFLKKSN